MKTITPQTVFVALILCACALSVPTSATAKDLKNLSKFPLIAQPDGISCGPTCCAMVLGYYGKHAGIGPLKTKSGTRTLSIEYSNKRIGLGTMPGRWRGGGGIEGALEAYGVPARVQRRANFNTIVSYIRQNRPPILLVRSGPDSWHYMVAVGYTARGNRVTGIKVADPAGGKIRYFGGSEGRWLAALERAWTFSGDLSGNHIKGRRCRLCGGDGNLGWTKCAACSGSGKIKYGFGWTKCPACGGRGKWSKKCDLCGGDGTETDYSRKAVETAGISGHTLIVPDRPPRRPQPSHVATPSQPTPFPPLVPVQPTPTQPIPVQPTPPQGQLQGIVVNGMHWSFPIVMKGPNAPDRARKYAAANGGRLPTPEEFRQASKKLRKSRKFNKPFHVYFTSQGKLQWNVTFNKSHKDKEKYRGFDLVTVITPLN